MTNPLKGESPLKACGKVWTLKLPFGVAKGLKVEHGIDLLSGGADMGQIDKFDVVLGAMLKTAHPEVAEADVFAILDDVGISPVIEAMQPALAAFMGVPVETLKAAAKAAQAA